MITVKTEMGMNIKFPQTIEELVSNGFESYTKNITLCKHYAIVVLAAKTNLFNFCTMIGSKKDNARITNVTPIIAKVNEDGESCFSTGEIVIIDRSSLERGQHVNLKTAINSKNAAYCIGNSKSIYSAIIKQDYEKVIVDYNKDVDTSIIVLEAKIVPICDIKGTINSQATDDIYTEMYGRDNE